MKKRKEENIDIVLDLASMEVQSQSALKDDDVYEYAEENLETLESVRVFIENSPLIYETMKEALNHIKRLAVDERRQATKDLVSKLDRIVKLIED